MDRQLEFQTTDIDLAAAIMAATGRQPQMFQQSGKPLVAFEYKNDDQVRTVIMDYAAGELFQSVKRFSACRAWLYRQAKAVRS